MADPPVLTGDQFDAIIIGTGLPESILSAALSLSGATVLHLDPANAYGSHHGTLSIAKLRDLTRDPPPPLSGDVLADHTAGTDVSADACFGKDARLHRLVLREAHAQLFEDGVSMTCSREDALEPVADRVKVDLAARTVLGGGALVNLLIQTGVGHYLSFRPLDAAYLFFENASSSQETPVGCLRKVPASRSDVFQNRFLSMIEKRLLMRFLKSVAPLVEGGAELVGSDGGVKGTGPDTDGLFEDLMEEAQLTEHLKAFVRHCLAFTEDISPGSPHAVRRADGCAAIGAYLKSLARYKTPTPFLYPNYGSVEYCEAFCRLSAVHGGTFMLRKRIDAFVTNCHSPAPVGVVTADGDQLRASKIFVSGSLLEKQHVDEGEDTSAGKVWRYVALLDDSIVPDETPRALAFFPKGCCGNSGATVRVLQMNSTAELCPDGMYLIYAETVGCEGSQNDLASVMCKLVRDDTVEEQARSGDGLFFDDEETPRMRPTPLWSMCFSRRSCSSAGPAENDDLLYSLPGGVVVVRDVPGEMDAAAVLAEAERCFRAAKPEAEFFPKPQETESNDSDDVAEVDESQLSEEIAGQHSDEVARENESEADKSRLIEQNADNHPSS